MVNRDYTYIRMVAEHHNIVHAAEALYITPSALSKYVKRVETDLGVQLFHRIGKTLKPTYAGERYLAWMEQIQDFQTDMQTELKDIASLKGGRIRFGVPSSGVDRLGPEVIPAFFQRYPDIQLDIEEGTVDSLGEAVERGELDFAIITNKFQSSALNTRFLAPDDYTLIVPDNHHLLPYAQDKEEFPYPWIDLNLFTEEPFIVIIYENDWYFGYETAQAYGFSPKIICRMRTFRTITKAVSQGLGVAFAPSQMVLPHCTGDISVTLLSYGHSLRQDRLTLVYRKGHYLSHAARYLMDLCAQAYE